MLHSAGSAFKRHRAGRVFRLQDAKMIIMSTIVQWASILSPIIAVIIAIWTSRRSAKDTAKKLAALEENTSKQIESIKELSKDLIDTSIKQVDLEIEKAMFFAKQAKQELELINKINNSVAAYQAEMREVMMRDFHEGKPQRDYSLYCDFIESLEKLKKSLTLSKKRL